MADIPVNANDALTVVTVTSAGQVAFDYDFRADNINDLRANFNRANGSVIALVGGVDFTASGIGTATGGTITLTTILDAVIDETISIYRDTVISRPNDYSRDVFVEDLNAEQDKIFMIMQELARGIKLSISVPIGYDGNITLTPDDGKVLGWSGDDLVNLSPKDFINDAGFATADQGALAETLQGAKVSVSSSFHPIEPPDFIRTAGYYEAGDGGHALYAKAAAEPSHAGKLSISLINGDVVWYEIADRSLTLRSFGAKGDASDCTSEVLSAFIAGASLGRPVVDFGGIYTVDTINTPVGVYFRGVRGLTQFRPKSSGITMFNFVLGSGGLCAQKWEGFSIFCGSLTGVKGFQFTHANVFSIDSVTFYGCETNYDIDRGGHFHLGCGGALVSECTATLKAGRFKVQSSVDAAGIYGGAFATFGIHETNNSGIGVQSPAFHFRRISAMRFQPNSIVAGNDGTGNNTGGRTGTCVLVENDCQGLVLSGVIAGYDKGLVIQTGAGSASNYPRVNDFSQLDIDQCFTQPLEIINGENLTFTDVHVTSSDVSAAIVGAVKIHSTVGKGIRFNNLRVSGYYSGSGTAVLCENTDRVTFAGGFIQGCAQGIALAGATNLNVSGIRTDLVPVGRVGNPGAGTVVENCEGINPYDPWIPSNPVAVAGSGTLTSAATTLRWLKKGSRNHFTLKVQITTNGTGAGNIQVPMPFTAFADVSGGGREVSAAGVGLNWNMAAGSNTLFISKYDATYPGGNGFVLIVSGVVETAD